MLMRKDRLHWISSAMKEQTEDNDQPFRYHEQVLMEHTGSNDVTALRQEAVSQWNANEKFHPFGHLQQLFDVFDESSVASDLLEVSIKVSSSATQSFPNINTLLSVVPLLDNSLPSGPSGFWLCIRTSSSQSSPALLFEKKEKFILSWIRQRLINTPLLAGDSCNKWDVIQQENNTTVHQLFLPANGAAWSADALQQSFSASLGCNKKDFMGISATEWSSLLVTGRTWNKQMWWKLSSSPSQQRQVTVGVQYEQSAKDAEVFLSSLQSQSPDSRCLLGTRSVLYVQPVVDDASPLPSFQLLPTPQEQDTARNSLDPLVAVDMVIRRPWPQKGRLETWITAQPSSECNVHFRQVIPPFLTPSWQSLEVVSSDDGDGSIIQPSIEWNNDGTSIVTFSSSTVPSSLLLSLDYHPNFLTYDDFPGDPNRGRELTPAVVTVNCQSRISYQVYSNSPLILPPVPDMSMPFNVLSLACSLYAYLVGTLVTLLVKRASEKVTYKLHPDKKPKSKIEKIKEKIKLKFQRRKVNQDEEENGEEEEKREEDANQGNQ
jgi:hypothetical protein